MRYIFAVQSKNNSAKSRTKKYVLEEKLKDNLIAANFIYGQKCDGFLVKFAQFFVQAGLIAEQPFDPIKNYQYSVPKTNFTIEYTV